MYLTPANYLFFTSPHFTSPHYLHKLPSVELDSGWPPTRINLQQYTNSKSILLIGLPGAFTPT
jgi:peroxiredoxin